MDILLDSDIIIDYLNNQSFAISLIHKVYQKNKIYISVISWSETLYGFKKLLNINKLKLFQAFTKEFTIRILPVDERVAEIYLNTKIDLEKQKVPLADFDLLIAATAIANNLTLATRNSKHFTRIKNLKLQ